MPLVARSVSEVIEEIGEAIDDSFSRRAMRSLGEKMAETIKLRASRGLGVDRDYGPERRFDALSPRYVRYRTRRRAILAAWTSPRTSNVTLTGEMLTEFKAIQARDGSVTLGFRKRRVGLKAIHVHQNGRPWANISNKEFEQLVEYADENLGRTFRARRL